MIKILFVIDELNRGGASKILTELANGLLDQGFDISIYTYAGDGFEYQLDENIRYFPGNPYSKSYLLRHFLKIPDVRNKIKKILPDLVIAFMPNPNVLSILGTIFTNIPVIISERGNPRANKNISGRLKYLMYNFSDTLVCQSNAALNCFSKNIQKKGVVIPNFATLTSPISLLPKCNSNNIVYVATGRLSDKRQDLVLDAFHLISKKYEEVTLTIYGKCDKQEMLDKMVIKLGISDKVNFFGVSNSIITDIQNASLFVLTSDNEGQPNALIEAMCLGVPVISTDYLPGGASEFLKSYQNGILVPRGNSQALANAMDYMLSHPLEAKRMGNCARNIKIEFSKDKILNQWLQLIEREIEHGEI